MTWFELGLELGSVGEHRDFKFSVQVDHSFRFHFQCFDAVASAAEKASAHKKLSGGALAWLPVQGEV